MGKSSVNEWQKAISELEKKIKSKYPDDEDKDVSSIIDRMTTMFEKALDKKAMVLRVASQYEKFSQHDGYNRLVDVIQNIKASISSMYNLGKKRKLQSLLRQATQDRDSLRKAINRGEDITDRSSQLASLYEGQMHEVKKLATMSNRVAQEYKYAQAHDTMAGYNLQVMDKDAQFAGQVAANMAEGISRIKDFCQLPQGYCAGNLGIPRIKMPVIEPEQMSDFKTRLKLGKLDLDNPPRPGQGGPEYLESGDGNDAVSLRTGKIPVTSLKATQKEISASKSQGMADAALLGKFDPGKAEVLVSKDGYILDGHHRWAALQILAADPEYKKVPKMTATQVDLPVKKLLEVSNAYTDAVGNTRKPFGSF